MKTEDIEGSTYQNKMEQKSWN